MEQTSAFKEETTPKPSVDNIEVQPGESSFKVVSGKPSNFERTLEPVDYNPVLRPMLVTTWTQTTTDDFDLVNRLNRKENFPENTGEMAKHLRKLEEDLKKQGAILAYFQSHPALKGYNDSHKSPHYSSSVGSKNASPTKSYCYSFQRNSEAIAQDENGNNSAGFQNDIQLSYDGEDSGALLNASDESGKLEIDESADTRNTSTNASEPLPKKPRPNETTTSVRHSTQVLNQSEITQHLSNLAREQEFRLGLSEKMRHFLDEQNFQHKAQLLNQTNQNQNQVQMQNQNQNQNAPRVLLPHNNNKNNNINNTNCPKTKRALSYSKIETSMMQIRTQTVGAIRIPGPGQFGAYSQTNPDLNSTMLSGSGQALPMNSTTTITSITAPSRSSPDKSFEKSVSNPNGGPQFEFCTVAPEDDPNESATENIMVSIGPNDTRIPAKLYESMNWNSPSIATRKLLVFLFGRDVLATHSMTGKPSPAFRTVNKPLKQMLNQKIIQDIIFVVTRKCNVSEKEVRNAITTKCADENKMMKLQMSRKGLFQQSDFNKENMIH